MARQKMPGGTNGIQPKRTAAFGLTPSGGARPAKVFQSANKIQCKHKIKTQLVAMFNEGMRKKKRLSCFLGWKKLVHPNKNLHCEYLDTDIAHKISVLKYEATAIHT